MKEKIEEEYCEQCNQKSTTTKVRWDLEFPLVLCEECHSGFKTILVFKSNTKKEKVKWRTEHE